MAQGNPLEIKIRTDLVEYLTLREWLVEITHGSKFQHGIPDLFCHHVRYGYRWVECKRPIGYQFTRSQKVKFPIWEKHGVGIWILVDASDIEYAKLFRAPNWRDYWKPSYGALPTIDDLLRELDEPEVSE
ncbi:MAG: hypothetical protein ACTHK7_11975 [Aureliella sp.]